MANRLKGRDAKPRACGLLIITYGCRVAEVQGLFFNLPSLVLLGLCKVGYFCLCLITWGDHMTFIEKIARKSLDTIDTVRSNIDGKSSNLKNSKKSKNGEKTYENYDLEFDVSCNGHTFKFLNSQTDSENKYAKTSFFVEGYIYKAGTFENYGCENGVKTNGDPEFKNLLIGKWTSKGWYLNKGRQTKSGAYADSTHTYDLTDGNSLKRILSSNGKELIDMNTPFNRILSAGQGGYSRIKGGNVVQTTVGKNNTLNYNYTFKFSFRT